MNQSRSVKQPSSPPPDSPATARRVERVLRTGVPAIADFALVHVRAGRSLIGVAAAHRRREQMRVLRDLLRVHRLRSSDPDSAVALVVRTRKPLLRSDIQPERHHLARPYGHLRGAVAELHRRLAPKSVLVVPVLVRGVVLGALSLGYAESSRRYTPNDIEQAGRLASQVGYVLLMTMATGAAGAAASSVRSGTTLRRRVAPGV